MHNVMIYRPKCAEWPGGVESESDDGDLGVAHEFGHSTLVRSIGEESSDRIRGMVPGFQHQTTSVGCPVVVTEPNVNGRILR